MQVTIRQAKSKLFILKVDVMDPKGMISLLFVVPETNIYYLCNSL